MLRLLAGTAAGAVLTALGGRWPAGLVSAQQRDPVRERCRELQALRSQALTAISKGEQDIRRLQDEAAALERDIALVQQNLNNTPPDDPRYQELLRQLADLKARLARTQANQAAQQQIVDRFRAELAKIEAEYLQLGCACILGEVTAGTVGARAAQLCCPSGQTLCGTTCCANGCDDTGLACRRTCSGSPPSTCACSCSSQCGCVGVGPCNPADIFVCRDGRWCLSEDQSCCCSQQ